MVELKSLSCFNPSFKKLFKFWDIQERSYEDSTNNFTKIFEIVREVKEIDRKYYIKELITKNHNTTGFQN